MVVFPTAPIAALGSVVNMMAFRSQQRRRELAHNARRPEESSFGQVCETLRAATNDYDDALKAFEQSLGLEQRAAFLKLRSKAHALALAHEAFDARAHPMTFNKVDRKVG